MEAVIARTPSRINRHETAPAQLHVVTVLLREAKHGPDDLLSAPNLGKQLK